MQHSRFQIGIFDHFRQTDENQSVVAVAGSGKSTTLEHLVRLTPISASVLVMAFNRDIVTDLKPRMTFHPQCEVATFNSFGNRILRQNVRTSDIDEEKTDNAMRRHLNMRSPVEQKWFFKWRFAAKRLMDLFRANLVFEPPTNGQIFETMDEYSIDPPFQNKDGEAFCNLIRSTYATHLAWTTIPDFRDQLFMPIYLNHPIPKYDYVFVDEDQDLDRNQAELCIRAAGRFTMVGDPRQSIYRFRGAMADAVNTLEQRMHAKRLPLSVCYRCPRKIIASAQKIVPEIEACDWATEGIEETVKDEEFRRKVREGDLVICRCTKPLVSECLALIRQGKRAKVKGREIGQQLRILIEKLAEGDFQSVANFNSTLQSYYTEQMDRLGSLNKEQQQIDLTDRVDTIKAIMESCDTVGAMYKKIAEIFTDSKNEPGIVLMTIHKCKGLENPRVWILDPKLLPHPRAKKPEDREIEMNLKYVAITRVKFKRNTPKGVTPSVNDPVAHEGELYWVIYPETKKLEDRKPEVKPEVKPEPEPEFESAETVPMENGPDKFACLFEDE